MPFLIVSLLGIRQLDNFTPTISLRNEDHCPDDEFVNSLQMDLMKDAVWKEELFCISRTGAFCFCALPFFVAMVVFFA